MTDLQIERMLESLKKGLSKTNEDHPDYDALLAKIRQLSQILSERALYRERISLRLLNLWYPIRNINRSKLSQFSNKEIIEIGKTIVKLRQLLRIENRNHSDSAWKDFDKGLH